MKRQINPVGQSKIAYAAVIQSGVNLVIYALISRGVIPQEAAVDALTIGNAVSGGLIYVFRRWYTEP